MNSGKGHLPAAQIGHGGADGLRHIEEFEVDEDLLAAVGEPAQQLEIALAHEQGEADLEETDMVAELLDEAPGLLGRADVEGEDEPVPRRDCCARRLDHFIL